MAVAAAARQKKEIHSLNYIRNEKAIAGLKWGDARQTKMEFDQTDCGIFDKFTLVYIHKTEKRIY